MESLLLVVSTFPDAASARQIGTLLVERQLAACVNILPGAESVYRWKGNLENSNAEPFISCLRSGKVLGVRSYARARRQGD